SPILSIGKSTGIFGHDAEKQVWFLAENYKSYLFRKIRGEKTEAEKVARSLLAVVLKTAGYDEKKDRADLIDGGRSSADKRDSGCRERAGRRGPLNFFTGEDIGEA